MIFGLVLNDEPSENDEEDFLDIKIYRDDKLFYEESLKFNSKTINTATWTYWDNKIIRGSVF